MGCSLWGHKELNMTEELHTVQQDGRIFNFFLYEFQVFHTFH